MGIVCTYLLLTGKILAATYLGKFMRFMGCVSKTPPTLMPDDEEEPPAKSLLATRVNLEAVKTCSRKKKSSKT